MANKYDAIMQTSKLAKKHFNLTHFPDTFNVANTMQRKFIAYLGPTNSGKTYQAMQALKKASSGTYLAPLRLLALENYDVLFDSGVDVSLITGDEKRISPSAEHSSATVEMANFSRKCKIAIIDEVHMLADPQRGFAWTAAIVGIPAETVYLIGPLHAEPALRALVSRIGGELEVHYTERKAPLHIEEGPINVDQIRKGDGIIVFSRKEVLHWKDILTAKGLKVASVYGNLSAEVRSAQAQAFRDGEVDVIVGTDALSMGLNLPIHRIVFTTSQKFDGEKITNVDTSLVQQIAGRAGRFGLAEEGRVGAMTVKDHTWLTEQLQTKIEAIPQKGFFVAPTAQQLMDLQEDMTKRATLSELLTRFQQFANSDDKFFVPTNLADQIERAKWVQNVKELHFEDQFMFTLIPSPAQNEWLERQLKQWVKSYAEGKVHQGLNAADIAESQVNAYKSANELGSDKGNLIKFEDACKLCSAYAWLAYRKPEMFKNVDGTLALLKEYSEKIDELLRKQNKQKRPRK